MFIVGNLVSCLFWGVLIAAAVTGITLVLINVLADKKSMAPLGWLATVAVLILLSIQMSLMVGAIKAKSAVEEIAETMADVAKSSKDAGASVSNIKATLVDEYPYVEEVIDLDAISIDDPEEAVEQMAEEANSSINWYIARRMGWSLAFVVVGTIAIVMTMTERYRSRRSDRRAPTQNRRAPISTRTARRRR